MVDLTTPLMKAAIAAAQASQARWHIPASITLAQFGIESAWGTKEPPASNNPFGIKAVPGQTVVGAPTLEFVHGQMTPQIGGFAVFPDLATAFEVHGHLLATSWHYAKARAALPSIAGFCNALTGVYATDPNYGPKLISLIASDNLTIFDAPPPAAPSTGAKPVTDIAAGAAAPVPFTATKPVMASQTIHGGAVATIGGVIALLAPLLPQLLPQLGFNADQVAHIVAAIGAAATVYGGVMAIVGRFRATTTLK